MNKPPRGNLYEKNGYYHARIYYYVDGKRKSKDKATGIAADHTSTRKSKQQERAANQFLENFLSGFVVPGSIALAPATGQMLADTVQHWLAHISSGKAPGTRSSYAYIARDISLYFREIAPVRTADLTTSQVESYLAWERKRRSPEYTGPYKVSPQYTDGSGIESTVHHRYTALRSIMQYAKREGIVTRNVASKRDCQIDVPRPQRQEFQVLTDAEASVLIDALLPEPIWFQVSVLLGLLFGLRRSEIIGLRTIDIDWNAKILTISRTATQQTLDAKNTVIVKPFTKNRRPKVFAISDQLCTLLQSLIDAHEQNNVLFGTAYNTNWPDYLIRYDDGKLVSPNALTRYFKQFIDRNKFKSIRFHDLRHSCASILYANGIDLMTIQEILGHAQLTTTIMYTHKLSDRKTAALTQMSDQFLAPKEGQKEEPEN